jgi:hypothetical protein
LPLLFETVFPQSFARVKDTETTIVIVSGYPSSSIQLLDALTKKPIEGAKVTINTTEKTSDTLGLVVFDVPDGKYTVKISHSAYLPKTLTLTLPMAEPVKVDLWPLWAVGLGVAAGATIGVAVIAKVVWK